MKDRAPITIHDYEQFMANSDAVAAKLANSRTAGISAFFDGTVSHFEGYSETFLKHEYQARLELDEPSVTRIQSRVTNILSQSAVAAGAPLLTASKGLEKAHITLQTCRFGANLEDDAIQNMVDVLNHESKFNLVAGALKGRSISFDRLVAGANGSFYLCSSQVVPETLKARNTVSKLISRKFPTTTGVYSAGKSASELEGNSSLSLVEFRDITHCVVGRLVAPTDRSILIKLLATAEEIDGSLQNNPLEVSVGNVRFDSTYNIMAREVPGLVTKK